MRATQSVTFDCRSHICSAAHRARVVASMCQILSYRDKTWSIGYSFTSITAKLRVINGYLLDSGCRRIVVLWKAYLVPVLRVGWGVLQRWRGDGGVWRSVWDFTACGLGARKSAANAKAASDGGLGRSGCQEAMRYGQQLAGHRGEL